MYLNHPETIPLTPPIPVHGQIIFHKNQSLMLKMFGSTVPEPSIFLFNLNLKEAPVFYPVFRLPDAYKC